MGRLAKLAVGILVVLLIAVGIGFKIYRDKLYIALPDYPPVKEARWLGQAWSDREQDWYHHADQGTQTLNIPYEWFIALEQPRLALVGDVGRLGDPAYLDRYGFIPGATRGGEIQLPIGFAKGGETVGGEKRDDASGVMRLPDGQPWLNPRTKKPMHKIGFTCAACHTGRLTYRETALLVDGGPALTDLGKFRQGLGIAILFTKYLPGRFDRFAMNVLGEDASEADKAALHAQLDALWDQLDGVRKLDKGVEDASIEEGYGRLDALNRIGNQVFALDLDKDSRAKNYAATTAPVNFPHVWSTSWFDWVQYNASIEQPMVRNAGEALGVSAPFNLTDPGRGLFASGVHVENLTRIEKQIAGEQPDGQAGFTGLRAPRWPELLGPVVRDRAASGAALYDELCKGCHLPPIGRKDFWESKAWRAPNAFEQRYLHIATIPIAEIGTDPAQAEDMIARRIALPEPLVRALKDRQGDEPSDAELGKPDSEGRYGFGFALGVTVKKAVDHWYDTQNPPMPKPDRQRWNGYRPNGIQALAAYKARPLNGIWATPPFLHNGSVPSVYALLSPVSERPKAFTLGRREFDPVCLGYQLSAVAASEKDPRACLNSEAGAEANRLGGLFTLDTSKRGNFNTGHEFGSGKGSGIIGRPLSPEERLAIVEFLKTDCVNGPDPDPQIATTSTTRCDALGTSAKPASR